MEPYTTSVSMVRVGKLIAANCAWQLHIESKIVGLEIQSRRAQVVCGLWRQWFSPCHQGRLLATPRPPSRYDHLVKCAEPGTGRSVTSGGVGIHMYAATAMETTQQYSVRPLAKGHTTRVVGSSLIELCHNFVVIQVKLSSTYVAATVCFY